MTEEERLRKEAFGSAEEALQEAQRVLDKEAKRKAKEKEAVKAFFLSVFLLVVIIFGLVSTGVSGYITYEIISSLEYKIAKPLAVLACTGAAAGTFLFFALLFLKTAQWAGCNISEWGEGW